MRPETIVSATMGLVVPFLAVWTVIRLASSKYGYTTAMIYQKVIPLRIKRHPFPLAFMLVWTTIGVELMLHRLPLTMWPKLMPSDYTPSPVKYIFAALIIASGLSMFFGYLLAYIARWAELIAWLGSLCALGLSIAFVLGLIRVLLNDEYVWPEFGIAAGFWAVLTVLLTVAVVETRKLAWARV